MKRRVWWLLAGVIGLMAVALWLFWPGDGSPLARLLRRDLTWEAMQARGTVRVGMDPSFPPFEDLDGSGAPAGFDVEFARQLAAEWGLKAEIVAIGFDSLVDALKATKVDVIISAFPYDARLTRDVVFSQPYFDAGLRLAVREGSNLKSTADLAGMQVAVEWGSVGDMVGRQLQREGIALQLQPFETPQGAVQALVERTDIDALLIDNVTLRQAQAQGSPIVAVGEPVERNPYVIVSPIRAPELQKAIDTSLSKMVKSGALAALEEQWFRSAPPPSEQE
jgi:ABC-type amino acid transport substrate-binding protein